MTVPKSHVYLYAATVGDYEKALAVAQSCGIPRSNVIGNYSSAWTHVSSGNELVIAVGGAALYALYYNPCGWANPSGATGGRTPFHFFTAGHGVARMEANYFINAAGFTALDTLKLTVMLAYYAVHGTFPVQFQGMPRQEVPQDSCVKGASPNVTMNSPVSVPAPATTGGVGVYADFSSVSDATRAMKLGWKGIGNTGALGTKSSPYTAVLPTHPDSAVAEALAEAHANIFWLSFWTVSWPAAGDTFYAAGNKAGKYAANYLTGLPSKYLPNYLILDPEGYNTPANTTQEWKDFIQGWADAIHSVNKNLKPGFYCNQSQYETYSLNTIMFPAFIAVSPIIGNQPYVKGGNIEGYIAYYTNCPSKDEITQVERWGGRYNTVQFMDSGVDCGPA